MKRNKSENDTMTESELQKIYNVPIYPRGPKIHSDRKFVNIDDGSLKGSQWTCFIVKDNESFYYDSFGGSPDKFLLNLIPKPKTYHNYKIQDIILNYAVHIAYNISI